MAFFGDTMGKTRDEIGAAISEAVWYLIQEQKQFRIIPEGETYDDYGPANAATQRERDRLLQGFEDFIVAKAEELK